MPHKNAVELARDIQSQLEHEWSRLRDRAHNPSNKGASYEDELSTLLNQYFSGVFDIITQPVLIDPKLEVFDIFDTSRGEHEIDVVGLFRQSKPRIVFEISDMVYAPLEGTAFICEVKKKVDKEKLEKDLQKLQKVENLCDFEHEMTGGAGSERYATSPPVKCLVYDEKEISTETFEHLISEYNDCWDMIFIAEWDALVMNSNLPITDAIFVPKVYESVIDEPLSDLSAGTKAKIEGAVEASKERRREKGFFYMGQPVAKLLINLSILTPSPVVVHTARTLQSLNNIYAEDLE